MVDYEIIKIPIGPDDVGRVIGRAGSHIKCIRDRSGCDVEMITTAAAPFVLIKGHGDTTLARRMVAQVAGGAGIAFIRDLTDHENEELNRWLKEEVLKWSKFSVQAELRGKTLRITSKDQETSISFKKKIEERLCIALGLEREQVVCSLSVAASIVESQRIRDLQEMWGLRVERELAAEDKCIVLLTGMGSVVREAASFARDVLHEGVSQRCQIPIWHGLMMMGSSEVSPEKLRDFKADINDLVIAKYGVDVVIKPNSVVVKGEYCNAAAATIKEILQYYFKESCAIIELPDNYRKMLLRSNLVFERCGRNLVLERCGHKIWFSGCPMSLQHSLNQLRIVLSPGG